MFLTIGDFLVPFFKVFINQGLANYIICSLCFLFIVFLIFSGLYHFLYFHVLVSLALYICTLKSSFQTFETF